MNNQLEVIESYIMQKFSTYEKFMRYSKKLPIPQIIVEENKINASHNYDVNTNSHTLTVGPNILKNKLEPVLYHEFTHIYDVATISAGNSLAYAMNRGFTEYHAGQIELLKFVGANTKDDKVSFSLSSQIDTVIGSKTVIEYILYLKNSAREGLNDVTFPANKEIFILVTGMIFNFLGRVSICRLYAEDYSLFKSELENLELEKAILGEEFSQIVAIANTFLDLNGISEFGRSYFIQAANFIKKYNL